MVLGAARVPHPIRALKVERGQDPATAPFPQPRGWTTLKPTSAGLGALR